MPAAKRNKKPVRRLAKSTMRKAPLSKERFPNENAEYRRARNRLLKAEITLRQQVEAVAALRRKLPLGGAVPEDYVFEEPVDVMGSHKVKLSGLFAPGKDTLILYSFMYGPAMAKPCPMCTSFIDSLDGAAVHVAQRANFAIVAKSPLPRILTFARERGWRHLKFLSSAGNNYNRDYFGENPEGSQWPILNVFVKRKGKVHHSWGSELMFVKPEKDQDSRHVDLLGPLWHLLDLTPEGRGKDWYTKLSY
ncbi:MAG TPA: DUF899 family protein [Gammaproteobacteria bacterium]|nr:DUF899 family protein [Gammaproteobacteria bacterium]